MAQHNPESYVNTVDHQRSVTFLCPHQAIGGTERMVCRLSREFAARGWLVQAVFPETAPSATLEWIKAQGVTPITAPGLQDIYMRRSWRDVAKLRDFLRQHPADVVNLHYGTTHVSLKDVLAVRLAGKHRCVVSVCHPVRWDEVGRGKRIMSRLAFALCHRVTACAHAMVGILREVRVPMSKIRRVPWGLPVPENKPDKMEARARLGLPATAFIVGCVTRLIAYKGVDQLIEAAARVADPKQDLVVAVAGNGPEREHLQELARERLNGRGFILGHVPDIDDLYAACDVFALPSHMEGFGLVYIEAAFHGSPSLAADVGGVRDVIVDGETGVLVRPGDIDGICKALQRFHDDLDFRQRLGEAAQKRAYAEFTEARMGERFEEVFRN